MSITEKRIEKAQANKQKRRKVYSKSIVATSVLGLTVSAGIVAVLFGIYKQTEKWDTTTISGVYADIPAEFAKNNISPDLLTDINSLSSLNSVLNDVYKNEGLTNSNINKARETLTQAKDVLEKHGITSGSIYNSYEDLLTYVNLFDVEATLYKTPNSQALVDLIGTFSNKILSDDSTAKVADTAILERLGEVSSDYDRLANVLNTLTQMGTLSGNTLKVDDAITIMDSNNVLQMLREGNLRKFPAVNDLEKLLTGSKWTKVLINNETLQSQARWENVKSTLMSIATDNYVSVKSIKTYEDALKLGLVVNHLEQKEGYTLLTSSLVENVLVNGEIVTNGYINKYANISVTIKPNYKLDESEQDRVKIPESDDDKEDSDDDDTTIEIPESSSSTSNSTSSTTGSSETTESSTQTESSSETTESSRDSVTTIIVPRNQ